MDKDNTEYTSLEAYVADCLERKDLSFFPINRALSLQSEGGELEEKIRDLESKLDSVLQRFRNEDLTEFERAERIRQHRWEQHVGVRQTTAADDE